MVSEDGNSSFIHILSPEEQQDLIHAFVFTPGIAEPFIGGGGIATGGLIPIIVGGGLTVGWIFKVWIPFLLKLKEKKNEGSSGGNSDSDNRRAGDGGGNNNNDDDDDKIKRDKRNVKSAKTAQEISKKSIPMEYMKKILSIIKILGMELANLQRMVKLHLINQ